MTTDRTSLSLPDERKRLFEQAEEIVADGSRDDPPRSDVIDAALTHLIQSAENIDDARSEYDPQTIKDIANTDVLRLYYRTDIESPWRR
ncbi:hypothetical protein [Natrinema versiforme]|uniref:Uncharacterized protein n=2 Tax=root TaxID=1 RepID=A0A4P8WPI5_9EURY|nr:hypothetical protein [Natrinema versiforme]YP_010772676.1 hypothetical protein QIT49_gp09 [Natrinema versiforme icosahedral virus 1]QCS45122.1 hypothetical protein FEJ81_22915 [Natrinema versiforme]DAC85260.1 TPA_asm: hypothetical protein NVIV1gp21 [Natrinema versiforme icosahedral virus 1]